MHRALIAALATLVAACGGGGQNNAAPDANPANVADSAGNRVAALPEGQRNAVFIRAIRDAGLDCQHVERSVPAGTYRNVPAWRATCQGGHEWTLLIGPDGTAQILPDGATLDGDQADANAAAAGNGQ